MAHVRTETTIDATPEEVWDALRDWGALHDRLAPGFVIGTRVEGDERVVTFFNGAVARELIVDVDDDARRIAYAVVESPLNLRHHHASAQVLAEGADRCRFVWTADLLPEESAQRVRELMDRGTAAVQNAFERQATSA
ncbi:SRPBCC family protein [Amycolatopsis anabasis]|uniref:SRPBCC family protein n=1 Tax=Amycolatopsis anabasis TaxID=1840409 RepID=UPI00131AADB7|nr:SRPBCC family protein [Amycolatopsis anabasis]